MLRAGRRRAAAVGALIAFGACLPAHAWPASLVERIARDARRLVPRTLAQLLGERETLVMEEMRRFPPSLAQALAADLSEGLLRPATLGALARHGAEPLRLLQEQRLSDGVVRLGALRRIPADLADPIVTAGPPGFPAGLAREYYAFIEASLAKMPVTLHDPAALELRRADLPAYWSRVHADSRAQAAVLRAEMVRGGRVVDHRALDFRSPVFAVAQISWSRAVTAVAATWLATWREARGDLTRRPAPRRVEPDDRGPSDGPSQEARP
jgi:hypothetical protein